MIKRLSNVPLYVMVLLVDTGCMAVCAHVV